MAKKRVKRYNATKEVKAIARERIGTVPPTIVIEPKARRKELKHKRNPLKDPSADLG